MQRDSGFTIVELLLAITIAAVLLALAVPSFRDMLARRSVDAALEALTTDLRYARSEAVRRNDFVTICRAATATACATVKGDWAPGWIVFADLDGNGQIDTGETILRAQGPPEGIASIAQPSGAGNTNFFFTFRGNGLSPGAAATLQITPMTPLPGPSRAVCLSFAGRVAPC